jgi:hypothetical protein
VPPFVTALGPGDIVASAFEDEDVLNAGALLESSISDGLGRNRLATTTTLIRGEEDAGATVLCRGGMPSIISILNS